MPLRLYSVEEARDLLEELKPKVEALQDAQQQLQFAVKQGRDLEQMWDEEIHDPACHDHDDYVEYTRQAAKASADLHDGLVEFHKLGVEVKDVATGLIDFHTERASGEIAYLCWKKGEETIEEWHPMFGGFRGRRPLEEL